MTTIQVIPNDAGRLLLWADVLGICRAAQHAGLEIPDQAARCIASYWQSSGNVGSELHSLATGAEVEVTALGLDISHTIRDHYASASPEDRLMLDMLGTWFVRKVNDQSPAVQYEVISDEHSGHGLPIGAVVTPVIGPDWDLLSNPDNPADWYTQGVEGDERAIDPRDLKPVCPRCEATHALEVTP